MKLTQYIALLPLVFTAGAIATENTTQAEKLPVFQFSAKVSREVDKDLMTVVLFSEKEGKSVAELKKAVSANLNAVITQAKKTPEIEVVAQGVTNSLTYNNSGKVSGWRAFGSVLLKSKDMDALSNILENLGENVAIQSIHFSVSPEKEAALQDEMTAAVIKQFQHQAEVVKTSLNAKGYRLANIQLDAPMGEGVAYRAMPMAASFKMAKSADEPLPLEAGKETLSATATGSIVIEP